MAYEQQSPAANRLRPESFDNMVGQEHLIGKNGIIRRICDTGRIPSMVFFGPPGTGKTTASRIIAASSGMTLRTLNATSASLSDVKNIIAETGTLLGSGGILLYLDEIQYFNKKQQQSLLEFIEDGRITLIASTTENPYYYIYSALLSRCSVFEFRPVSPAELKPYLKNMLHIISDQMEGNPTADDGCIDIIAHAAGGDVRRALTMLEVTLLAAGEGKIADADTARELIPSVSGGNFDSDGDVHYDLLSGLQKSIRGSDPDAAVFYLARLLEGGDLISPCRRLMVIASEDIGAAYPMAAVIVRACVESAKELGLPEARIPLANAVVMLATAPKSNTAYSALDRASEAIKSGKGREVPTHLRSPLYKGYKYPHSYPGSWVKQNYLPDDLLGIKFYEYGENKTEQAAKQYWDRIKGKE